MVEFMLLKNSKICKGKIWKIGVKFKNKKKFKVYWWSLDDGKNFFLDIYEVDMDMCGLMVLDVFIKIKNEIDLIFMFWCLCWEGVCGLCVMNIDGWNMFVCIKVIEDVDGEVLIYFLLYMEVVKDLVLDFMIFYI